MDTHCDGLTDEQEVEGFGLKINGEDRKFPRPSAEDSDGDEIKGSTKSAIGREKRLISFPS